MKTVPHESHPYMSEPDARIKKAIKKSTGFGYLILSAIGLFILSMLAVIGLCYLIFPK